jgi:hypothetical protein
MLRYSRQFQGMFVNNRNRNIHKLLDHRKYLDKHEYNHQECLLHKNKVVEEAVVVGQVVAQEEQQV